MSECSNNCESCGENCSERKSPQSLIEKPNELSSIGSVFAVMSGKGGVGKSLVTSAIATILQKRGKNVAILDADVTGPSIPRAFGLNQKAQGCESGLLPVISKSGIQIMSINLLLENDTDPVVWRGPVISGAVKQFWTDVIWSDVDYMFIDMPPGTGDVPLTVFQSIPVKGIIVVTSPQELVSMIVEKAVKMAGMLNVPVIGIVENYSYFTCPDCGSKHSIFGESHIDEIAAAHGISTIAKQPIDSALAKACDTGNIEDADIPWLQPMADMIEKL